MPARLTNSELLPEILDRLADGVLGFDTECRYTIWNCAMERISGLKREQVLGRVAFEVFPFLTEIGEDRYFHAALAGESLRSEGREYTVREAGRTGIFDGEYSPICDGQGNIVGGIAIIRDRTETLRILHTETELKEEKALLETLLRTGEIVAAELDLERIVQAVTDAATRATGAQFGAFFYNVINQKGESYMLYTLSGVPREAFSKFPMPRNTAVFEPTFSGKGIVRSDDITADPRYGKSAPHHGQPKGHLPVRSYLAASVLSRSGEVIGGLFFGHSEIGVFAPSSERLVDAMAKQAAVAIENARLYEQQKAARQAAEQSEARANSIWSSISDGFVFFDREWRYTYVNRQASELIGLAREELLGRPVWDLFTDEASQKLRAKLEEAVSLQRATHFEFFFETWQKWLECHCYPSADGLGLYFRDITARREAEQALRKAEERLRLVTDSTELGLWYCDLPFDVLNWSEKTKEHFWLAPDDPVTIDIFYERIHPEDRERTRRSIERSIYERVGYDIDYRTVSNDGQIKWIRAIGRAFYNEKGEPIRFDGVTVDNTDRKLAEDALRRSEKLAAAGRLSATIAHEINNPLAAVTNLLFLARSSRDLDEIHNSIDIADQELKRVAHITKQTLGFYKDSGAPSLLNLAEVMEQVLSIYKRRLESRNISVSTQFRNHEAGAVGNSGELRQVVSNLIANAIDAMAEGGRMVIRVSATSEQLRVSVADNGVGISPAAIKRIFEPFHTTKTDVGTGLGLWVSRQIIEKHGGSIRFRSSTRNGSAGTTFSFTIPRSQPVANRVRA
jgi:PAS domain S-box-containing protein